MRVRLPSSLPSFKRYMVILCGADYDGRTGFDSSKEKVRILSPLILKLYGGVTRTVRVRTANAVGVKARAGSIPVSSANITGAVANW